MIHSFFFISSNGDVLIEKHWRGISPRSLCEFFWEEVNKYDTKEDMPPVVVTSKYYLISALREGNFLLATTTGETPPLVAIEFLHRVFDIFAEYFGDVEETTIKENFATCYQLLEEMMDYGYPLTTEPNALKAMIKPPTVLSRFAAATTGTSNVSDVLPDGTISNMPWRKSGVKYSQNEIYIDIIEEIDSIIDARGNVVSSEVSGILEVNCKLSGVPDLTLTFVDPELIDDCSFHPCVRYNRFERDRVISFVPPDGVFELMRYRVHRQSHAAAPCYCQPNMYFDYNNSSGTITVNVGQRATSSIICANKRNPVPVVEEVSCVIPFSKNVRTANLSVSVGTLLYDEASKIAKWTIGKLVKDKIPQLTGNIVLQPGSKAEEAPPIELNWKVITASVSGLAVGSLTLTNERYRPYKGVRAIAKSGKYQIRSV